MRSPIRVCDGRSSLLPERPLPNELRAYRNREWGYSMPRPDIWFERKLEVEGGQGVMFTPDPVERSTAISVEVQDLGTDVTPEDLPDLQEAFLKGLRAVPGSRIERHAAFESPFHVGLEAQQTFEDGGQRRRRWIRVLYKGALQARLIAQGATLEEFDRLRPLFAPCMTTFLFGDVWPEPPIS